MVLAFARYIYQQSELPLSWLLACVAIMMILSVLSYYLIENPLRQAKIDFKRLLVFYFVIPTIVIFSLKLLPSVSKQLEEKSFFNTYKIQPCYQNLEKECHIDSTPNASKALLIGDSHAMHLLGMFEAIAEKKGINFQVSPANDCPFILNYTFDNPANNIGHQEFCKKHNPFWNEKKLKDFSYVIISNFWSNKYYYGDENAFYKNFDLMLDYFSKENKKVYIINSSGRLSYNPNRYYHLNKLSLPFLPKRQYLFNQETEERVNKIKIIVEQYPSIVWVDLRQFLPNLILDYPNVRVFFDDNHLTFEASKALGELFLQKYPNLFEE